jgi:anti-sigma regulatory factor (Ser/Thr protein kinase)
MTGCLGATADLTYELVLAVDETTTKILLHGYCGAPGEVEVEVRREGQDFVVTL